MRTDIPLPKKSRKQRGANTDDVSNTLASTAPDHDASTESQELLANKHRKKRSTVSSDKDRNSAPDVSRSSKKEKSKKHAAEDKGDGDMVPVLVASDDSRTERRRSKKKAKTVDDTHDSVPDDRLAQQEDHADGKRKKRKQREEDDASEKVVASTTKKRKKKADKSETDSRDTGIVNPSEDESLSEQAMKALTYAYLHYSDRKSWKFSKPRQIWLIRNLWSESQIPEKYTTLVAHYVSSIQSSLRTKLTENCKELIASNASESEVASAESLKLARASIILKAIDSEPV